jgi:hypothetical protein
MANHVCSTLNNRHCSAALFHGSASPCQQIAHRTIVPISASGSADASIIECLSYGPVGGRSSRQYLSYDRKDVESEGVRCFSPAFSVSRLRLVNQGAARSARRSELLHTRSSYLAQAGIQYAAAFRFWRPGLLDHPLSRRRRWTCSGRQNSP